VQIYTCLGFEIVSSFTIYKYARTRFNVSLYHALKEYPYRVKKMIEKNYLTQKMYALSINDSTGKYLKMQY